MYIEIRGTTEMECFLTLSHQLQHNFMTHLSRALKSTTETHTYTTYITIKFMSSQNLKKGWKKYP